MFGLGSQLEIHFPVIFVELDVKHWKLPLGRWKLRIPLHSGIAVWVNYGGGSSYVQAWRSTISETIQGKYKNIYRKEQRNKSIEHKTF